MRLQRGIDYLVIWKNLHGVQLPEEQAEFEDWLKADVRNEQFFKTLKNNYDKEQDDVKVESVEKAWSQLHSKLKQRKQRTLTKWLKVAAAVAIPLVLGVSVLYVANKMTTAPVELSEDVSPGQSKAFLELDNGQTIVLESTKRTVIQDDAGSVIGTDSLHILKYDINEEVEKVVYNTIRVPRGGEYQLELSDGTKVWLNSETTMKFPVNFIGQTREVELEGEALFEVTKNQEKPFMVHPDESTIKVLGTTFNVMCYPDDLEEETTLVEGSVAIEADDDVVILEPGEQCQLASHDHKLRVRDVDTDIYTAWRNGVFVFDNQDLETILRKVSRWYDVEVTFENHEDKDIVFRGNLPRYSEWTELLKVFESSSDVDLVLEGRNLIVK